MKPSKNAVLITCILCASLLVCGRQLAAPEIFSYIKEDMLYYLNWSRQYADSLAAGIWYPRWMPESHAGYGNPTFIFYPPLVICLTAGLKLLTGDIVISAILVKFLGVFLSGLSMYLFIKDVWGPRAGLASAVVYMALPFRVFDVYFLGIFASKFAYVWFPLILYFTRRAVKEERIGRGTAGLAVSYALLCLTHLLSAYMFLPVLLGFGAVSAGRGKLIHALARAAIGCLLGLLLSAFYVIPALSERPFVHFEELINKWQLQYWNVYLYYIFGPGPRYILFFNPYLAQVVLVSAAIGISANLTSTPYLKGGRSPEAVYFIAVLTCTLLLMSSLSGFLWASAPGLRMLQFPSRWASVLAFAAACLAGSDIGSINKKTPGKRRTAARAFLLFFIACSAIGIYYDAEIIQKTRFFTRADLAELPGTLDVDEYVPRDVSLEWLWAETLKEEGAKVVSVQGEIPVKIYIRGWYPERREFFIEADQETRLRIRTFYYPGWEGTVGGRPATLSAEPMTGAILLTVPKGGNNVILSFSDTRGRRLSKVLSATAGVLAIYLFAVSFARRSGAIHGG